MNLYHEPSNIMEENKEEIFANAYEEEEVKYFSKKI